MDDPNGGGFPPYNGKFQFPPNPTGCDYMAGYFMVFGANPATMRIGMYDDGKMLVNWQNATLQGSPTTNADLKTGLFIIPTANETYILSAYNGTLIEKTYTNFEIDFSDVDRTFYYVDKTSNQYALRHVYYPNPVPDCKVFLGAVWNCGECNLGHKLNINEPLMS